MNEQPNWKTTLITLGQAACFVVVLALFTLKSEEVIAPPLSTWLLGLAGAAFVALQTMRWKKPNLPVSDEKNTNNTHSGIQHAHRPQTPTPTPPQKKITSKVLNAVLILGLVGVAIVFGLIYHQYKARAEEERWRCLQDIRYTNAGVYRYYSEEYGVRDFKTQDEAIEFCRTSKQRGGQ